MGCKVSKVFLKAMLDASESSLYRLQASFSLNSKSFLLSVFLPCAF